MNWLKQNWFIFCIGFVIYLAFFVPSSSYAYGDCSSYGFMASYDYLSGGCKCMSGYVFGKDFMGKTTCVSGDSVCYDKYGYSSRYDSISGSCECSYGHVFGKDSIGRTQCISEDQSCKNQYGYNARSTYGSKCECSYGYVIDGGQCTDGNTLCRSKHGLYSSYNDSGNTCDCDSGYTLNDSSQCVKKQNNVYFFLKELDTDNREAIIKSNYDSRYYKIDYGMGCLSSTFERYVGKLIVVNLGTDYSLDNWDQIVLQNDNQTCNIVTHELVDSDATLTPTPTPVYVPIYIPIRPTPTPTPDLQSLVNQTNAKLKEFQKQVSSPTPISVNCKDGYVISLDKKKCYKLPANAHIANDGKNVWLCNGGYKEKGNSCALNTSVPTTLTPTPTPTTTPKANKSFWSKLKFW